MQCERARDLLSAHVDGELALADREAIEAHIATCRLCRDILDDYRRIGRAVVTEGRQHVPPMLVSRISRALDVIEDREAPAPGAADTRSGPRLASRARLWLGRAAAVLLLCALSAGGAWWVAMRVERTDRLERELLNAHVRSLLQDSPVQVASSEQHTVKPWFAGRIDIAPPVRDLTEDGFALVGGRLDYVDAHRASVLVYRRRLHIINVFMWQETEGSGDVAASARTRNGYNLVSLRRGGIRAWLVSDLNVDDLQHLASRL